MEDKKLEEEKKDILKVDSFSIPFDDQTLALKIKVTLFKKMAVSKHIIICLDNSGR